MTELELSFPAADQVVVRLAGESSAVLPFVSPLSSRDHKDLAWYLETYGAHSLGEPDDREARRIAAQLPAWGKALFDAVFGERPAQRLFNAFQDDAESPHLLTIRTAIPSVLGLPWELLHDSARGGVFLFNEQPPISIRRWVTGGTGGRRSLQVKPKERLHLLFIVSRPTGSGFLDPRADAAAVLDAFDEYAPGRFTWEFLRPPTIDALTARLRDQTRPPVDIIHFDGHGAFDPLGGLPERLQRRSIDLASGLGGTAAKEAAVDLDGSSPPNTGYLVFEAADGEPELISADQLGFNLHRQHVPLVVLSACQSAAVGDDDEPMGSVAVRLTAAGIPAVLAMTHSVLVYTTRPLFGAFYGELARRRTIGEAIDAARLHLYNHPEKYQVQRGPDRVWLKLRDWFVPTLYQAGVDVPLMRSPRAPSAAPDAAPPKARSNIQPAPAAGFYGRRRELWHIERWFEGPTRRITISGFGGQGKTALAQEAARWLLRVGLFEAAVFVAYKDAQIQDSVGLAVSEIAAALGQSLPDAQVATQALREVPTLVVLDNLEALGSAALGELLEAAAAWSEAGRSRVLLTTRAPDFDHPAYANAGTFAHRRIVLTGLGRREDPEDALEWFAQLSKVPPPPTTPPAKAEALVELFDQVKFHPLSISVLAQQLKSRRPAELGRRLAELLLGQDAAAFSSPSDVTVPELVASVNLSLDRLDPAARALLPRLGVFKDGAFEDDLLAVTGLDGKERAEIEAALAAAASGDASRVLELGGLSDVQATGVPLEVVEEVSAGLRDRLGELLAPPSGLLWPELRRQLDAAGLIYIEKVPDVRPVYLRFHPTLAPLLWSQLSTDDRARLTAAHRQRYQGLADYLNAKDDTDPVFARAIVRRDLPNLLQALQASFDANAPEVVRFATSVLRFLDAFGLTREANHIMTRLRALTIQADSEQWLSAELRQGEWLLGAGKAAEAATVFSSILATLPNDDLHTRALTLQRLARAHEMAGQPRLAVACLEEAIADTEQLEPTARSKRFLGSLDADRGDNLRAIGDFAGARAAYARSLRLQTEAGDPRGQVVALGQLGALALILDDLDEARRRYEMVLELVPALDEPLLSAISHHQLGVVYQEAGEWAAAERHYREAARIKEALGDIGGPSGAASTWGQLGLVNDHAGNAAAAETWYLKSIEGYRSAGRPASAHASLGNLADLLTGQPGRLAEARQCAEEARRLKQDMDPAVAKMWAIYSILATIANKEAALSQDGDNERAARIAEAREYQRLARAAKWSFAGTHHELQPFAGLIAAAVEAIRQPGSVPGFEQFVDELAQQDSPRLAAALRQLLRGERDADVVCADLSLTSAMIVMAILAGLADPRTLDQLRADESAEPLPDLSPG